jgi:hypothetical protein
MYVEAARTVQSDQKWISEKYWYRPCPYDSYDFLTFGPLVLIFLISEFIMDDSFLAELDANPSLGKHL